VPRTDENGRHLRALLDYLLDGRITNRQISQALGISSSSYYRRIKEDDYPNADELHKIADRFRLSFTDLQVRLGFVTREDLEGYIGSAGLAITADRAGMAP
jgi:transcriptional regulator with XRE-family HTH domain